VLRKDVFGRSGGSPVQTLDFENVSMHVAATGEALVNSARMYDTQGVLQVGDFDFDGRDDFAVQVGNDGPYGGPTFDVVLQVGRRFVRNAALSELTRTSLGMFQVDAGRKHLVAYAKSGCCWHETRVYAVAAGQPVLVGTLTEDARVADDGDVVVTEATLIGGQWVRRTKRHAMDAGASP